MTNDSQNLKKLKKLLADSNYDGKVALFIGAGVNGTLLPKWENLIKELRKKALSHIADPKSTEAERKEITEWLDSSKGPDLYDQADLIRYFLGPHYAQMLHATLYPSHHTQNFKTLIAEAPNDSPPINKLKKELGLGTFCSTVKLCRALRIAAVVTFNYDDLLNEAVARAGKRVIPIYGERQAHVPAYALPFYYVHGYLPRDQLKRHTDPEHFVLCREEYHRVFKSPYAWQNIVPIHLLRTCICIFIGASMTDMNMRRLTSYASHHTEKLNIFAFKTRKKRGAGPKEPLPITATQFHLAHANMILAESYSDLSKKIDEITEVLNLSKERA